jgi:hypothetical protein
MFCIGALQGYFDQAGTAKGWDVLGTTREILSGIEKEFGVKILSTMDDDQLSVGAADGWPFTGYVVADAPSLDSVVGVCDAVKQSRVGDEPLTKFIRFEARLGRPLFEDFGVRSQM